MASTAKRKVRRRRHRPSPRWMFGEGFCAPIIGQDMRVMHHFRPIDTGRPFQLLAPEDETYLRTFQAF